MGHYRLTDDLRADPAVMFHMLPLPVDKTPGGRSAEIKPADEPNKGPSIRKKDKNGRPSAKGNNKGCGKGKSKISTKGRMPQDLIGLQPQTKSGKRMCYNFNLPRGCDLATAGQECSKRAHLCMKCFGSHSASQCSSAVA